MSKGMSRATRRIMVFGASGRVGKALTQQLREHGESVIGVTRGDFDLSESKKLHKYIVAANPTHVINCAAFNGMEACEADPQRAFIVNAAAPATMSEAAARLGAHFVHFSTDYVFEGRERFWGAHPIPEVSMPSPNYVYSRSKYLGEFACLPNTSRNPNSMVFRVSSIYDQRFTGPLNPLQQFLDGHGLTEEDPIKVFSQQFTPTSAATIAKAVLHAIDRPVPGIFNLVTSGVTSRCEFAAYILRRFVGREVKVFYRCEELAMRRPINVCLSNSQFERTFSHKLPTWQEDVDAHIAEGSYGDRHSEMVRHAEGLRLH